MEKKIGIITFHRSRNYGAVLQNYALQKSLENMGFRSEVIDYENSKIAKELKLWNPPKAYNLKFILVALKQFVFRWRKKIAFDRFLACYVSLSKKHYVKKEQLFNLSNSYTAVITGSDQVWNEQLTDNDGAYYLDFVDNSVKKIAYAVSAGDSMQINQIRIRNAISEFSDISVRESTLKNYLNTQFRVNISLCCDPTLLLESNCFEKVVKKKFYRTKYIFLYMIQDSKELLNHAQKIADERNLILISNKNCIQFFLKCSPIDFLSWIYHAEYIITNSFHGTIFSIHFEKQFVTDVKKMNGNQNQRVLDLLEPIGLKERAVRNDDKTELIERILLKQIVNYRDVKKCIKKMKEVSWKWLEEAITK